MSKLRIVERKLGRHKVGGVAPVGLYWEGDDLIEVDPRQGDAEYFGTILHELLHHAYPYLSEEQVVHGEETIAPELMALGCMVDRAMVPRSKAS